MSLPMSMASQIFQPEEGIPLQHIVLEPIATVMITPGTPPSEEKKNVYALIRQVSVT